MVRMLAIEGPQTSSLSQQSWPRIDLNNLVVAAVIASSLFYGADTMGMTLVTGASGFVGSHFMEENASAVFRARCLPGNCAWPLNHQVLRPEADWSNQLEDVETVVHLAARVHVMRETASDPLSQFREANVGGTVNLARQAAEAGVRRFVFVSSIKVNGENTEPGKPFTADDPVNPQDPYSISKAEA